MDDYTWSAAYTYTVATALTIINDSDNTTRTSTINNSNATLASSMLMSTYSSSKDGVFTDTVEGNTLVG